MTNELPAQKKKVAEEYAKAYCQYDTRVVGIETQSAMTNKPEFKAEDAGAKEVLEGINDAHYRAHGLKPPSKIEGPEKRVKKIKEIGNAVYYEDGTVEIFGDPSGLPRWDGLTPAPFCDETERQRRFQDAIEHVALEGYLVLETKRVRNEAFDKKGQKTSQYIVARACKNEDEIKAVHAKIMEIMNRGALKQLGIM